MQKRCFFGNQWRISIWLVLILMFLPVGTGNTQVLCDVNNDGSVGLPEAIYALQVTAGLKPIPLDQETIEQLVNSAVVALNGETGDAKETDGYQDITQVLNATGLDDAVNQRRRATLQDIQELINFLSTQDFPCGDFDTEGVGDNKKIIFIFNGSSPCNITGTVKIDPELYDQTIVFHVEYVNVQVDDCNINGKADTTLSVDQGQVTATHSFTDMMLCGESIESDVMLVYDISDQKVSVQSTRTFTLDGVETTVKLNYTYSIDQGLSGSGTTESAGETHTFECQNIKLDPECGIPNSGTLTIDNTITMDFSNTSCDNPQVEVKKEFFSYTIGLQEAIDFILNL